MPKQRLNRDALLKAYKTWSKVTDSIDEYAALAVAIKAYLKAMTAPDYPHVAEGVDTAPRLVA